MASTRPYRENYRTLLSAVKNRKAGFREHGEKIIRDEDMRRAERVFWKKRGFDSPPEAAWANLVD